MMQQCALRMKKKVDEKHAMLMRLLRRYQYGMAVQRILRSSSLISKIFCAVTQ